jgi:enoyl-CoA hydratase/carnithine racemase
MMLATTMRRSSLLLNAMRSSSQLVETTISKHGVAVIRLNSPKALNALTGTSRLGVY